MSLAKCLKKLKIDSSHEDSIISGLASLTEQGNLEGYRKATLALDQAMNDTLDEQEDIHIQLEKQGYSFKEDNSVKDSKLLEEKLNKQGYTFTITPKSVRDFIAKDKTKEAQATTATNLASKFGKRITWIDAKGDFGINGVVVPNIKDVIFLDVNTKYPAHAVMGHELSHHLEYDKPDVYKDLVASMEGLLKNHKEYADKYKIEGASHKDIVKEMIGDIMGDNFTKQDFWNKLADQDRSLFTKIADTIKAWLEQFIKSDNLGSDAFVKDVKKAREVIALAVAKYKDVQQPTQSAEAKFSRTPKSLDAVEKSWDSKGITSSMSERNGIITLNKIVVPKDSRNAGMGTAAMRELTNYADTTNQQIALTPSADFGGNKVKLQAFYKRLGFRKNNEFNVMESMIRDPESAKFSRAIPYTAKEPIASNVSLEDLKAHPKYQEAKHGNLDSAISLVNDLISKEDVIKASSAFGKDVIYVPVTQFEKDGINRIPYAIAQKYASETGASINDSLYVKDKAFHTGMKMMERLIARTRFEGDITKGKYVLVDDVTSSGATLADLSSYIQEQGGDVVGSVLLTNAMRGDKLIADKSLTKLLETKYGNEIRELFGIEPSSLTREEAKYLQGFRTPDELRASANKASASRAERIRIKTLSKSEDELKDTSAKFSRAEKDYRMEHQSPGREGNAPLSDLTGDGNIYPEDVYSNKAVQYYGTGDAVMDKQSFLKAKSYRGKPDAIVEVYRAVPKGISDTINPGDWVTINNNYAKDHGEAYFDGNYDILSKKVKAGDIFTNGDSIHEWGYEPDSDIKFSRAPKLFSKLEQVLESASDKIFSTGSQVKLWLQSNAGKLGIKKDEIYWSGIDNWLDAQGKVSKQQVVEFVRNNGVKVEDVTLGVESAELLKRIEEIDARTREISLYPRDANTAKNESDQPELDEISAEWEMLNDKLYRTNFPKHNNDKLTLPGGTDYKELVVTVPTIEPHNAGDSTHFGDTGQGKQIGWLRMDTRDGGLFLEELQSQRAQQGRSKGFRLPVSEYKEYQSYLISKYDNKYGQYNYSLGNVISDGERNELYRLREIDKNNKSLPPPAPFVSDANNKATNAYITLLMKKALIEAVSNDHASVSWTTGDQQADRYDLSKQISMVSAISNKDGTYNLIVEDKSGNEIEPYSRNGKRVTPAEMEEVIGKDLSKKVVAGADLVKDKPWPKSASTNPAFYTVRGVDLKIGGEWAQSMYGNEQGLNLQGKPSLISQAANDIFKHVGSGKVESINGQPGFYITPEMRSKDLPLFSKVAPQDTIKINGVDRPTTNSEGKAIHPTREGISNFWKWFGDSKVVDKQGRPLVVYHGTDADITSFNPELSGSKSNTGAPESSFFFTDSKKVAESYTVAYEGDFSKEYISGGSVMPVYLRIEDLIKADAKGDNWQFVQYGGKHRSTNDLAELLVESPKYDGVVVKRVFDRGVGSVDKPSTTYIVKDNTQIKSAIGNNGEYSSANNDIRFSKEAIPEETTYQKSQRTVQDKFNRFTVIRDWLKEKGVKLTELSNVYDAEERYHAKVANQLEDFREKVRNPLVEKIAKAGFTLSDVQDFLLAQHASEANKQIQKVRNDSEALAYGITDEEASEYLSKAKPELATLANELRDVTEQAKQLRLDAGILNKDITDNWDNTYKHYVPVKGDESIQGTGKGLNVKHKDKRRLGHEKRNEAVIENILMDYERAVMEVEKNRVGKYLVMFAAEANNPDLITVGQPEKRNILKENNSYAIVDSDGVIHSVYVNKVDAQRNAPKGSSIQKISDPRVIAQASPMLAPNEVNVYMDGHAIRVQLNDDLLARAYANMGVESVGAIVEAGRVLNSYLSKVYTGYNPEFIVTNIIRDFTSGIVNLTGEEGTLMAVKAIGNYPKMFADLFRYAITRKSTELIDSYRANGGNTGAAYLSDMERLGKEISSEYASYQGVIANIKAGDGANAFRAAGRKVFNSTLKWIEHLNQAGENAMRLSAYKAMLDSGKTVEQASKVAKNITVNFNRRGEIGQTANALYLFFNASVQGSAAVLHANLRGNHKYQANALAVGMASLGYMLAAGLGGMDEEEYDKIDDTTKERNLIIGSEGSYVKIPIPYGYGFFFNTGRVIADAQRKGEFGKAPFRMAVNAVEELTPFGNLVNSDEINSEQVVGGVAPTALQIPYQMSTNTSLFTGKEIRPVSPFDSSQPEREQMFRNTKGTVYDDMAGLLSNAGFDVSPENIKFLTRTLTGGAGALVDTAVSSSKLKAQGVELDIKEMPFIRKFAGENTISNDRSAYYKAVEEATKAAEEFSRARKNNDISSMKKIMEDKRELLAMDKYANKLRKVIKLSRDMQDSVRLNEEIPIAEKRLKLKELEAQESKLYDKYLDVYKARVK